LHDEARRWWEDLLNGTVAPLLGIEVQKVSLALADVPRQGPLPVAVEKEPVDPPFRGHDPDLVARS
jgi:hypothetical protein